MLDEARAAARRDSEGNLLPLTPEEIAHSEARIRYFEQSGFESLAVLYRSWLADGIPVPLSPAEKREAAARNRARQLGKADAAREMTEDVRDEIKQIETILKNAVAKPVTFSFSTFIEPPRVVAKSALPQQEPKPDPAACDVSSSFWATLGSHVFPALRARREAREREASGRLSAESAAWERRERQRLEQIKRLHLSRLASVLQNRAEYQASVAHAKDLEARALSRDPVAIAEIFDEALRNQHDGYSKSWRCAYDPTPAKITVELSIADVDIIPEAAAFRYIKAQDEIVGKPMGAKDRQRLYALFVAQTTLRCLRAIFAISSVLDDCVDLATLSTFVDTVDPHTGQPARPCLVSLTVSRSDFSVLNLAAVEPIACLKSLNARLSANPHEMHAVKPIVTFDMVDPRFINKVDVLSELDMRPNLAELSPSEFEALMTNLFEKMGLETRLTQASRDGGVDCVAWDIRPIFGGKVVIQAKRYKNTVGVSAVRDLYGTMMNESASKGILVTTSAFGKASYEFANGKPIELLNGNNLLYLLKEHAGIDAKVDFPDDWVDQRAEIENE